MKVGCPRARHAERNNPLSHVLVLLSTFDLAPVTKGSQLEVVVPDSEDLAAFVETWIAAAADAQSSSLKHCALLEPLESQDRLISLMQSASNGISECRKAMAALGASPDSGFAQQILQKAEPFVEAYKKHLKVAQGLMLVSILRDQTSPSGSGLRKRSVRRTRSPRPGGKGARLATIEHILKRFHAHAIYIYTASNSND